MRDIAAEAGVSVHLIQYYFGTKEQLLLYTAQHLARQLSERVRAWVQAAGGTPDPRTVIDGILTEALPTDEQSRLLHVVYTSYFALALTDPALTIQPQVGNSDAVIDVVSANCAPPSKPVRCQPTWTRMPRRSACWPCRPGWALASWLARAASTRR